MAPVALAMADENCSELRYLRHLIFDPTPVDAIVCFGEQKLNYCSKARLYVPLISSRDSRLHPFRFESPKASFQLSPT